MIRYNVIENYRKAERTNSIVLFNSYIGSCIELDMLSYSIFSYIEKSSPSLEDLCNYTREINVNDNETTGLINCLKELKLIYEIN